MAEVLLFHHARGLTSGVLDFAGILRSAGHTVHTPDLYEGKTFPSTGAGVTHAASIGFDVVLERGVQAAQDLPQALVYAGFSLGVMPAAKLAATRPQAQGALFLCGFVPPSEYGVWPGIPAQVHGMAEDPEFADAGDLAAAQEFAGQAEGVEVFVYPGSGHLFVDPSLEDYDPPAATLLTERVQDFLAKI
jgi:dienelactone hydrolase